MEIVNIHSGIIILVIAVVNLFIIGLAAGLTGKEIHDKVKSLQGGDPPPPPPPAPPLDYDKTLYCSRVSLDYYQYETKYKFIVEQTIPGEKIDDFHWVGYQLGLRIKTGALTILVLEDELFSTTCLLKRSHCHYKFLGTDVVANEIFLHACSTYGPPVITFQPLYFFVSRHMEAKEIEGAKDNFVFTSIETCPVNATFSPEDETADRADIKFTILEI